MNSAVALSLGGYHSCALMQDATVQCWGQSDFGQIGAPGLALSKVPVTVNGIANVTAVSAGFHHTCAVLSDGTVRCWGFNAFGQLGDGTKTDSSSPVLVQGIVNPLAVAAGEGHTCALMPDRSVLCWGENNFGALGNGTGIDSVAPVRMRFTARDEQQPGRGDNQRVGCTASAAAPHDDRTGRLRKHASATFRRANADTRGRPSRRRPRHRHIGSGRHRVRPDVRRLVHERLAGDADRGPGRRLDLLRMDRL
jgi:hypothetical protein